MLDTYEDRDCCFCEVSRMIMANTGRTFYKKVNIPCRSLLLVGDKDRGGKVAALNLEWSKRTGYPLIIIKGAAHNSNEDRVDEVNRIIREFAESLGS